MNNLKLRRLSMAAIIGAVAFILMYFSFSVPIISPFAEFDLSALPELIGGFILGPVGALEIIFVKIVLKLLLQGTSTMFTGELQNFLLSVSYVLPAAIYYRHRKSKKSAVVGLIIGSLLSIAAAVITNIYLIFPIYIRLYGMDWDGIVKMCSAVNPWIDSVPTMIAFSVIPFNVISRTVSSVIAVLVYKKVSTPLKKFIM